MGAQVLGEIHRGMGQGYCQGPLVGTDCFSLVNDFIKLPAKYRLMSSQIITIMWEVTAQPGYRDCSGVHLLSTRAGQPLPLPAAVALLGAWMALLSPQVHKVTRPCCTKAMVQPHRQHLPQPQPSRSKGDRGQEGPRTHSMSCLRGQATDLFQRGLRPELGSQRGEGFPEGKSQSVGAGNHSLWGLFPLLLPILLVIRAVLLGRVCMGPGQGLDAGGHLMPAEAPVEESQGWWSPCHHQ